MSRPKIISDEPKNYDLWILLVSIGMMILFWVFIGIFLSRNTSDITVPLTTIILATVTVLTALQNEIRAWWYRPKLYLFVGMDRGSYKVGTDEDFYIRIKVRNFGRGVAKSCYVKMINVIDQTGKVIIADPINLGGLQHTKKIKTLLHLEQESILTYFL